MFVVFMMGVDLICYTLVRQWVMLMEYVFAYRGERNKLLQRLREATTYEDWSNAAKNLDSHFSMDDWKSNSLTDVVDARLLKRIVRRLRRHRSRSVPNIVELCSILKHSGCKGNLGGIENEDLYSRTFFGTKQIVDDYVTEVIESFEVVADSSALSWHQKYKFFRESSRTFGKSALCLSGGAGFSYSHLGVIKALLDRNLLPKVLTGTSAGALIGSLIVVRTNEEIYNEVLDPQLAGSLNACADDLYTKLNRLASKGAVFDPEDWFRKLVVLTKGPMTFKEAYLRTGRILNVSVVSDQPHAQPKLLNYVTAPDVVIASAVIASSAIPGILPPVSLVYKSVSGDLKLFDGVGNLWRDGSLRLDIPQKQLQQLWNVSFTIASQVNPHVVLFFFNPRGSSGAPSLHRQGHGWRGGFIPSSLINYFLLDLQKWLAFVRDMDLLPRIMGTDLSNIWLQRFTGNVTIIPLYPTVNDLIFHLLSDPNAARLTKVIMDGQRMTFPKIQMISNRMRIEQCLDRLMKLSHRMSNNHDRSRKDKLFRRFYNMDSVNGESENESSQFDVSGSRDPSEFGDVE